MTTKIGIEVSGVRENHNRQSRFSQIMGLCIMIRTSIDVRTRKH